MSKEEIRERISLLREKKSKVKKSCYNEQQLYVSNRYEEIIDKEIKYLNEQILKMKNV